MDFVNVEDDCDVCIAATLRCNTDADDDDGIPIACVVACRLLGAPVDAIDVLTQF